MDRKLNKSACCGAALLMAAAGQAMAQPVIDGTLSDADRAFYGPVRWVQNVPTGFGNAQPPTPCDPLSPGGNAAAVDRGFEIVIPLASIGSPTGPVKVCAFINGGGHDYLSNQIAGSLPGGTGNLGGDGAGNYIGGATPVAGIDFNSFAGNQFVTIAAGTVATAPTIDGVRDASYGAPLFTQAARTGFGDSNAGNQFANGSELDNLHAVTDGTNLYIFVGGNLQTNFNKLEFFVDSVAGGQNVLTNTNPNVDFDGLNKMSGLTFDTGFEADYYLMATCGNAEPTMFVNFAQLGVGTPGDYAGSVVVGSGSGTLGGGNNFANIQVALDNSNTGGVVGACPPPAGPDPDFSNGSEIDGLYAYLDAQRNRLYVLVTGNLENGGDTACAPGGNKINLFIDAGTVTESDLGADVGQNPLLGNNLNVDIAYGNLNRMNGMTFDTGFNPDYWMSFKTQGSGTNASQVMDAAVLRANGKVRGFSNEPFDYGAYDGGNKNDSMRNPIRFQGNFTCLGGGPDPQPISGGNIYTNYAPRAAGASARANPLSPVGTSDLIHATINNSNVGGVSGSDPAGASCVTTGLEFYIDLTELGWDGTSCIKIAGFVANGEGSYLSNQVIGGLPDGTGNLGGDGLGNFIGGDSPVALINFNNFAGNQFVEVCNGSIACLADVDNGSGLGIPDGGVTIDDLLYYLVVFEAGTSCGADVDDGSGTGTPDGGVTIDDLLYFLVRFEAGC